MNKSFKIGLYVALVIAAIYFGYNFFSRFNAASDTKKSATEQGAVEETSVASSTNANVVQTNGASIAAQTNADAFSNTNTVAVTTNAPTTNATATPTIAGHPSEDTETTGAVLASAGRGKMWGYLGGFLGVLIVLGLLTAYEVTQYLGNRSVDFLFNDNLEGVHDPDYEQAEQMYANGKPLDAIQMLREYLRKNPRQQHAALRIAEIYEKDLGNYLAAALEYEEILKHNLPRERWGWAAIHLVNLYSKMGKSDQTIPLLRRIAEEYSETAAAKKARKRLAMYESAGDATALGVDMAEDPNMPDIPPPPKKAVPKAEEDSNPSNLPPGFRPKK